MPGVSVIIPTYNRSQVLSRAIDSVLNQSAFTQMATPFELLVVDDGSTDNTNKIVSQRSDLIYLPCPENQGVSRARNFGIEQSRYPWLAFLDSDDEWLPQKIELQLRFLQDHPTFQIVHGNEIWIRNEKLLNQHKKHEKFGGRIFTQCLPLCAISPSTIMVNRAVFAKVGLFDPEFVVCEDYELWLRLTCQFEVGFISEPIIKKHGGHADQLSRKFKAMDYWRVKALSRILDSPYLSAQERASARQVLLDKSLILLNGYRKHNNMENYQEIEQLRMRATI